MPSVASSTRRSVDDPRPPPHARSVDEDVGPLLEADLDVDRITRRAGFRVDDGALRLRQPVEQ
jgi:hypothetical protein